MYSELISTNLPKVNLAEEIYKFQYPNAQLAERPVTPILQATHDGIVKEVPEFSTPRPAKKAALKSSCLEPTCKTEIEKPATPKMKPAVLKEDMPKKPKIVKANTAQLADLPKKPVTIAPPPARARRAANPVQLSGAWALPLDEMMNNIIKKTGIAKSWADLQAKLNKTLLELSAIPCDALSEVDKKEWRKKLTRFRDIYDKIGAVDKYEALLKKYLRCDLTANTNIVKPNNNATDNNSVVPVNETNIPVEKQTKKDKLLVPGLSGLALSGVLFAVMKKPIVALTIGAAAGYGVYKYQQKGKVPLKKLVSGETNPTQPALPANTKTLIGNLPANTKGVQA